tara:strand:+ start:82 stop:342 length:261 start_codon:yes stop_codon:yes gene_type:complete
MHYTDRIYSTVLTTDLGSVDFSQVMETSANTVRKSIDETQFVLKWYKDHLPTFISPSGSMVPTWSGSHADCLTLMATEAWTSGSTP